MAQKKVLATLVALAVASFAAPSFGATNPPFKAKKVTFNMVRAYGACSVANTQDNETGLPACQPATPTSTTPDLEFGPKGAGQVTVMVTGKPDIKFTTNLTDIRSGGNPYTGTVYVTAGVRVTNQNCMAGPDCTQIDIPEGVYAVPITCTLGKCVGTESLNQTIPAVAVLAGKQTNVQILSLSIVDGNNTDFLVPGLFVP